MKTTASIRFMSISPQESVPGKRRNRPFEVLELDLSGLPTNRELTRRPEYLRIARRAMRFDVGCCKWTKGPSSSK
jgi:hypothetical protein